MSVFERYLTLWVALCIEFHGRFARGQHFYAVLASVFLIGLVALALLGHLETCREAGR